MAKVTSKVVNGSAVVEEAEPKLKLFQGKTSGDVYAELPDGKHLRLSCRAGENVGVIYDRYRDGGMKLNPFNGSITITAEA